MEYFMSNLGIPLAVVRSPYDHYIKVYYGHTVLDSYVDPDGTSTCKAFSVDLTKPVAMEDVPPFVDLSKSLYEAVGGKKIVAFTNGIYDIFEYQDQEDEFYKRPYYGHPKFHGSRRDVITAVGGAWITEGEDRKFFPHADIITSDMVIDCPVARAWGGATYDDCVDFFELNLYNFFSNRVPRKYWSRVQFTQAEISSKFQGKISMYMNKKDKGRDRKTALRPGRAFKFLFPELSASDIAGLVDAFNVKYPVVELTLKQGKDEADFIKAYSYEQSVMQNVYTTSTRKSLANSCMRLRPEHENLPKHPSAAYASGDFLSLWTEDQDGKIASRCVVYMPEEGKPQAGPIYGTSELSIDMIQDHLGSIEALSYEDASWIGARLLHIPCRGGVLAPYLDHEKGLDVDGDYLVISGHSGDYEADTYSGVLGSRQICVECDENVYDDDLVHSESGDCYCSDCYSDIFATCYESGNEHRQEDMHHCRVSNYRWGWHSELVYEPEDHDYILVGHTYYHPDVAVTTEQGNSFVVDSGEYFMCEITDEYHDIDQMVETEDGMTTSLSWVKTNNYVKNEDGVYAPQEEEKEAA
jgi:hypothetical protein